MTGKELLKALKESGTGENKLRIGALYLSHNPKASAEDLVAALAKAGPPIGAVTLAKAREFAGLTQPDPKEDDWLEDLTKAPRAKAAPTLAELIAEGKERRPRMPRHAGPVHTPTPPAAATTEE